MNPRFLLFLLLGTFAGCAKQADLPDIIVSAASPGEFAQFRAELGVRFTADRLKDFDTATNELQLDAMNRDVATAAGREADMLAVANGKPVHSVVLLGWQAREARFGRELAELTRMLDHDVQQRDKAGAATPESVVARIASEREVIAKLQRDLAETERRLAGMRPTPS